MRKILKNYIFRRFDKLKRLSCNFCVELSLRSVVATACLGRQRIFFRNYSYSLKFHLLLILYVYVYTVSVLYKFSAMFKTSFTFALECFYLHALFRSIKIYRYWQKLALIRMHCINWVVENKKERFGVENQRVLRYWTFSSIHPSVLNFKSGIFILSTQLYQIVFANAHAFAGIFECLHINTSKGIQAFANISTFSETGRAPIILLIVQKPLISIHINLFRPLCVDILTGILDWNTWWNY